MSKFGQKWGDVDGEQDMGMKVEESEVRMFRLVERMVGLEGCVIEQYRLSACAHHWISLAMYLSDARLLHACLS